MKNIICRVLFAVFLINFCLACFAAETLDNKASSAKEGTYDCKYQFADDEYQQIRALSISLLRRFPPDNFYYLGLGRSPTPVIAFLEASYIPSATIPLSAFRYGTENQPELAEDKISDLDNHFERFLPKPEVLGTKELLIIDYTDSGQSLVAGLNYIKKYYANFSENIVIKKLGIHPKASSGKDFFAANFDESERLCMSHLPLLQGFIRGTSYDWFAQHGSFDISKGEYYRDEEDKHRATLYQGLVAAIREAIKDDVLLPPAIKNGFRGKTFLSELRNLNPEEESWEAKNLFERARFPHLQLKRRRDGLIINIQQSKILENRGLELAINAEVHLVPSVENALILAGHKKLQKNDLYIIVSSGDDLKCISTADIEKLK